MGVGADSLVSVTETLTVEVPTADVVSDFSCARKQPAKHDDNTASRTIAEAIRSMEFEAVRLLMKISRKGEAPAALGGSFSRRVELQAYYITVCNELQAAIGRRYFSRANSDLP